jgi:hypothetical protein
MRNFKDTIGFIYINSGTHCEYVEEYEQSEDNGDLCVFINMIEDASCSMVYMGAEFAFEKTREDVCIQLCNILIALAETDSVYSHSIKKSLITKAKKEFNRRKKEG